MAKKKIIGNTVGMPNPRPDWNQEDSAKADYIKNKPTDLTTKTYVDEQFKEINDNIQEMDTEIQNLEDNKLDKSVITNDVQEGNDNPVTSSAVANAIKELNGGVGLVNSVNGKIGNVTISAADVGALPDTAVIPMIVTGEFNEDQTKIINLSTTFDEAIAAIVNNIPMFLFISARVEEVLGDTPLAGLVFKAVTYSNFDGRYIEFSYDTLKAMWNEDEVEISISEDTPDTTPIQDSTKLITSGAVYDAIESLTAEDVGARANDWLPSVTDIDAVPISRTINNKPLTDDIILNAEDVGAAPAGYGLGERGQVFYPESEDDLNNVLDEILSTLPDGATGFYCIFDNKGFIWGGGCMFATVSKLSNLYATVDLRSYTHFTSRLIKTKFEDTVNGDHWKRLEWVDPPMIKDVEYRTTERINGNVVYKKNIDDIIYYRVSGDSTWRPYANIVGAAPAGYGLGEKVNAKIDDVNEIKKPGFYQSYKNTPTENENYYVYHNVHLEGEYEHQLAIKVLDGTMATRILKKGIWQPWEWVNPPMAVGIEYRTAERHAGKPVYAKLFRIGIGTNKVGTPKYFAHNISPLTQVIRVAAYTGTNGDTLHMWNVETDIQVSAYVSNTFIIISSNVDISNNYYYAQVWYTKD